MSSELRRKTRRARVWMHTSRRSEPSESSDAPFAFVEGWERAEVGDLPSLLNASTQHPGRREPTPFRETANLRAQKERAP